MASWLKHRFYAPGESVSDVQTRLARLVEDLDLDHFSYGQLALPRDAAIERDPTEFATYPEEWIER